MLNALTNWLIVLPHLYVITNATQLCNVRFRQIENQSKKLTEKKKEPNDKIYFSNPNINQRLIISKVTREEGK